MPHFLIAPLAAPLAVALGAGLGALLRWVIGLWLNPLWGGFPLGTLAVNAVGGLLVGLAMAVFSRWPDETWRLLCVTGFLGGLTTFSTFSAESLGLIQRQAWLLALWHTLIHVLSALSLTAVGLWFGRRLTA